MISLYEKLSTEVLSSSWNSITLCSAYLTKEAAQSIINLFDDIKHRKNIKITIITGIKNYFTVPEAIRLILNYIDRDTRSNFEFNLMLPIDPGFHMKCYVFLGKNVGKALVGSANLTIAGLESQGELMVEVDDKHTIDEIVNYVDYYLNESKNWCEYIDKYEAVYQKTKPILSNVNLKGLFSKPKLFKPKQKMTIRFTAPTMSVLETVSKEQTERVNAIFDRVKDQYPDINKSNWIIYSDLTKDEMKAIKEMYSIGSCFDRPRDTNKTWEIGSNRVICHVGTIINTTDDEIVMFMKKGCIHYRVTEEIIEGAEKFSIKFDEDEDEDHRPTKDEMDNYKQFILRKRSK